MGNFSSIGFTVNTDKDFTQLLLKVLRKSKKREAEHGMYVVYTDGSGAALYLQYNANDELVGANPHFEGKSKRTVRLTEIIERPESPLDGAYYCLVAPENEYDPESVLYPFVFDVPDFRTQQGFALPCNYDIQLSAFARGLLLFQNEEEFEESREDGEHIALRTFIPSGLISPDEDEDENASQAIAVFSGVITEFEKKRYEVTKEEYYWLLVDTLGGEIDVVADIEYFDKEPVIDGVVFGEFWLSGRLLPSVSTS